MVCRIGIGLLNIGGPIVGEYGTAVYVGAVNDGPGSRGTELCDCDGAERGAEVFGLDSEVPDVLWGGAMVDVGVGSEGSGGPALEDGLVLVSVGNVVRGDALWPVHPLKTSVSAAATPP